MKKLNCGQEEVTLFIDANNNLSVRIGDLIIDCTEQQEFFIMEFIDNKEETLPIDFEKAKGYFLCFTDGDEEVIVQNAFNRNNDEEISLHIKLDSILKTFYFPQLTY